MFKIKSWKYKIKMKFINSNYNKQIKIQKIINNKLKILIFKLINLNLNNLNLNNNQKKQKFKINNQKMIYNHKMIESSFQIKKIINKFFKSKIQKKRYLKFKKNIKKK